MSIRPTRCLARRWVFASRRMYSIDARSLLARLPEIHRLEDIDNQEWKLLFVHLEKLRGDKQYGQVLRVGQSVLEKDVNARKPLYDHLIAALEEHHPTAEHGELAVNLVEKYLELGFMNTSNALNMMNRLCKVLVETDGPELLTHRFWLLGQTAPLPTNRKTTAAMHENLVKLYISSGNFEAAVGLIKEAAQSGHSLLFHINEIVFLALLERKDVDYAWEMMHRMERMDAIYARTWGLFINCAADQSRYDAIHWAYKAAIVPGSVVLTDWCYERVMDVGSKHGDYAMVRWCLLRMNQRKKAFNHDQNNVMEYIPLIEAHAVAGYVTPAFELLERIRESAEMIQTKHLPELITMLGESGMQQANDLFLEICHKPRSTESLKTLLMNLILVAATRIHVDTGLQFYRECHSRLEISPNLDTFLSIFRNLEEADPLLVDELFADCKMFGVDLSKPVVVAAQLALIRGGYHDTAEQLIKQFAPSNPASPSVESLHIE